MIIFFFLFKMKKKEESIVFGRCCIDGYIMWIYDVTVSFVSGIKINEIQIV